MINNLNDVIQNVTDLIESKKERLRILYETQSILKDEIIELEQAKIKLGSNEIHLVTDNKPIENKSTNIKSKAIIECLKTNGPMSFGELKDYFKCRSKDITCITYLIQTGKLVRDGISDKGKDRYSINTELKDGTN